MPSGRLPRGIATFGLALTLLASWGCRPDCSPTRPGPAPIVLLVTVDTLRADHLGAYGDRRGTTPSLDRLAAEGQRFSEAYAPASVTLPSHVSILTSLPLAAHGVVDNHTAAARPTETLVERFGAAGYRTAAFVSVIHLGPTMLLGRLLPRLERFEAPRRVSAPLRAEDTTDRMLEWLRGACQEPVFAWMHLWDPHMPYDPPAPFDRAYYTGDPYDPHHDSMRDVELDWALYDLAPVRSRLARHAAAVRTLKRLSGGSTRKARRAILYPDELRPFAGPEGPEALFDLVRPIRADLRRHLPFNPGFASFLQGVRDIEYPRALYAGEVSYVDRELGRLRRTLEAWGIADRVVLVVTGDHGEGLGEHGLYFNHIGVWDEMLRVPLIVWAPGRVPPAQRDEPASGVDVAPTLLALAGLEPSPEMEGRNLLAPAGASRPIVAEAVRGGQIAIRDGRWKLVRTHQPNWVNEAFHPAPPQVELYDLTADPGERTNRVADVPDAAAALGARLDAWMHAHGLALDGTGYVRASAPLPPDQRDRLRALGYLE